MDDALWSLRAHWAGLHRRVRRIPVFAGFCSSTNHWLVSALVAVALSFARHWREANTSWAVGDAPHANANGLQASTRATASFLPPVFVSFALAPMA
jgi:hypothetical protein